MGFSTKVVFDWMIVLLLYSQSVARLLYFLDDDEFDAYFSIQQMILCAIVLEQALSILFHDSERLTISPSWFSNIEEDELQRNMSAHEQTNGHPKTLGICHGGCWGALVIHGTEPSWLATATPRLTTAFLIWGDS